MYNKEEVKQKTEKIFEDFDKVSKLLSKPEKRSNNFKKLELLFNSKNRALSLSSFNESKHHLCFIGAYSVGKSTFINALIGRGEELLKEQNEKSTTAFPTYIYAADTDKEYAEIAYLSVDERKKLLNFYLTELPDKDWAVDLDVKQISVELVEKEKYWSDNNIKFKGTVLSGLKNLLNNWENNVGETKHLDDINEIKCYIEEFEESIIISSANLYLNANIFGGRKDIVLVDLPGLDAQNPRHYDVTKRFAIDDAKARAYIVVTIPDRIENNTVNDFFLKATSNQNADIEKAFWIINKCDGIPTEDIPKTKQSLLDFTANNRIKVYEDRVFMVSAKMHKERQENELSIAIDRFRDKLINYLQKNFDEELLKNWNNQYLNLKNHLINFLKPRFENYDGMTDDDKKLYIEDEIVDERFEEWQFALSESIKNVSQIIDEKINKLMFFDEITLSKLKEKIDLLFDELSDSSYNNMLKISLPKDVKDYSPAHYTQIIYQKIKLNERIREEFSSALKPEGKLSYFVDSFDSIIKEQERKFNFIFGDEFTDTRFLEQRIAGICDIALMNYKILEEETMFIATSSDAAFRYALLLNGSNSSEDVSIKIGENEYKSNITSLALNKLIIFKEDNTDSAIKDYISIDYKEQFNPILYYKLISKHKMRDYLEETTKLINDYVFICLSNYSKDLLNKMRLIINGKELKSKASFLFRKEVRFGNSSEAVNQNSNRKMEIYNIYNNLKNND